MMADKPRFPVETRGRQLCECFENLPPRHLFKFSIQAAIGWRVIACETIAVLRKGVTPNCYGGVISRKRKLLD